MIDELDSLDPMTDPDRLHDEIACGDRPDPHPRHEPLTPTESAAVKRAQVAALWRDIAALRDPDDPPETMREVEDDQLDDVLRVLRRRLLDAQTARRCPRPSSWRDRLRRP